ncbi:spore germination protein [Alteribacillus persepolensis]|uniref:Spore germination protein n=1 Tax=Alteribacillus persepolensis TaxID=568899 RepID=A0A1G7ZK65_9BACI|nr:Ger(x)C family spore germination protein [Alteribacillus persepolensis]SDH09064.1 spore germination protein [Alteribacillus persepolensis]
MKRKSMLALLLLVFTTGCIIDTQIIDEILLIQTIGIDKHDEDQLKYTVTFPVFLEQGEENTLSMEVQSIVSETTEEARNILNQRAQQPLRYGQVRVTLFGKSVAEEGLEEYVKSIYRNPRIGSRIYLSVTDASTEEVMSIEGEKQKRIGLYFSDLIEQNIRFESIPETNMHLFLFDMYSDGKDAYLPLIKKAEKIPQIEGLALFDSDRYVDSIDLNETYFFSQLRDGNQGGTNQFSVKHEGKQEYVVIENVFSDVRYKEKTREPYPVYDVDLKVQAEVTSFTGNINLNNSKAVNQVKKQIEQSIKTECEKLIQKFQDANIDPLGFGEKYRSQTRDWNPTKWKDTVYPNIEANVHVHLEILQSGAIE